MPSTRGDLVESSDRSLAGREWEVLTDQGCTVTIQRPGNPNEKQPPCPWRCPATTRAQVFATASAAGAPENRPDQANRAPAAPPPGARGLFCAPNGHSGSEQLDSSVGRNLPRSGEKKPRWRGVLEADACGGEEHSRDYRRGA
jgi:hypothetical protein